MILHLSHIGFTEALTFMLNSCPRMRSFPVDDATLLRVVRADLDHDAVAWKDADVVTAHLAPYVSKDLGSGVQLDEERRIGTRLQHHPFGADAVLRRLVFT
jgi:hypothetical protein